ncbi:hypothetical protein [Acrocarpospora pleiomorpha]|uniref:hypothetical protein n=1 Tax=Acrocarpospora pleiomorpha TaxID=90975 RepID=UPI0012D346D6|nr:hypothetical protein [Acrocarpospora pleiomorpha]
MLRDLAQTLQFARIGSNSVASIQRTIARWENGTSTPDDRYQVLLAHAFARTPTGDVSLGPGSDFAVLLNAFEEAGTARQTLDELTAAVAAVGTDMGLAAFLSEPLRADIARALADGSTMELDILDRLGDASAAVNRQIGTVPFVRLHLAQAAIVEVCRRLLGRHAHTPIRARMVEVAGVTLSLAARLAFENHDDAAALALYDEATSLPFEAGQEHRRALIRTSQTMVVYYATGDLERANAIANAAVQEARRGASVVVRARCHALQAEMAARSGKERHARTALHLAWHDLDLDTTSDPAVDSFTPGHLQGFVGVCGIFIGEAEKAEQQLASSAAALTGFRDAVQRGIVLADRALAVLRTGAPGAAEATAGLLHECVDLTAATRARVPAQRLRQTRLALRPWRTDTFVADLDDHIHTALVGL